MNLSKYKIETVYIITYLLIAFSGIPFFENNRIARAGYLLLLAFLFFYHKKKIGLELIALIACAIYIILFQTLYFGGGKLFTTVTNISLLIILPYFFIKLFGPGFLKYFRNIMLIIALLSIGFWVAVNLSPAFHSASLGWAHTLGAYYDSDIDRFTENYIIYTYEINQVYGLYRNPGPFHEPGAFSVFLILAIITEIFINGKLISKNNILFFINLITTFSTAGFLGMFIIISFYVYTSNRMTAMTKIFVSVSVLATILYLFLTLEFLGDKITNQIDEQSDEQLNTETVGRFLGARKALIVLYRYPLFGRGYLAKSRAAATSDEGAGYGWITWVSRIGVVFGIIYMFLLYKALRNYSIINLGNKHFAMFAFLALLAVLSGQKHTSSLVFFGLFLLPFVFPFKKFSYEYLLGHQKPKNERKSPTLMSFSEQAKFSRRFRPKW